MSLACHFLLQKNFTNTYDVETKALLMEKCIASARYVVLDYIWFRNKNDI